MDSLWHGNYLMAVLGKYNLSENCSPRLEGGLKFTLRHPRMLPSISSAVAWPVLTLSLLMCALYMVPPAHWVACSTLELFRPVPTFSWYRDAN